MITVHSLRPTVYLRAGEAVTASVEIRRGKGGANSGKQGCQSGTRGHTHVSPGTRVHVCTT